MLKSADALAQAGYTVRVVATSTDGWAIEADRDVRSRRAWPATIINYRKGDSGRTYWRTGVRSRVSRAVVDWLGAERAPLPLIARAIGRVHPELVRAIAAEPADLVYGGTTGALAAIAEGARRIGAPYALDLEDFHSAEIGGSRALRKTVMINRVEDAVLPRAIFLTTSSEYIAEAYRQQYGVATSVVHNTFPLPAQPPDFARVDPARLRVYWFSQTIGPGRGLDEAVVALGQSGVSAVLALRGRDWGGYLEGLKRLAAERAPRLEVQHLQPAAPDAMVDLARGYDVGLALEQMVPLNRALCLSNKAFTYLLAGVAVILTDTPGQHAFGHDVGSAAALVRPGDSEGLATVFRQWADHPSLLEAAKRAAWDAAVRRWHWDHPKERGVLLNLVSAAVH
jgi:glycosyltransferase involved in cell wall biosynthesis